MKVVSKVTIKLGRKPSGPGQSSVLPHHTGRPSKKPACLPVAGAADCRLEQRLLLSLDTPSPGVCRATAKTKTKQPCKALETGEAKPEQKTGTSVTPRPLYEKLHIFPQKPAHVHAAGSFIQVLPALPEYSTVGKSSGMVAAESFVTSRSVVPAEERAGIAKAQKRQKVGKVITLTLDTISTPGKNGTALTPLQAYYAVAKRAEKKKSGGTIRRETSLGPERMSPLKKESARGGSAGRMRTVVAKLSQVLGKCKQREESLVKENSRLREEAQRLRGILGK